MGEAYRICTCSRLGRGRGSPAVVEDACISRGSLADGGARRIRADQVVRDVAGEPEVGEQSSRCRVKNRSGSCGRGASRCACAPRPGRRAGPASMYGMPPHPVGRDVRLQVQVLGPEPGDVVEDRLSGHRQAGIALGCQVSRNRGDVGSPWPGQVEERTPARRSRHRGSSSTSPRATTHDRPAAALHRHIDYRRAASAWRPPVAGL